MNLIKQVQCSLKGGFVKVNITTHLLQTEIKLNNKSYLVSSIKFNNVDLITTMLIKLQGFKYELMVFEIDSNNNIIFNDLYCYRTNKKKDIIKQHISVCNNLKDYI